MPKFATQMRVTWVPLLAMAGLLIWHSLQYNFVTDDAYISFVYSENFAKHGQLVFNYGHPPVEGYTNFLWTAIMGVLMVFGLPPATMSLVLGTGFALGTLWVTMHFVAHLNHGRSGWDYLAPCLLASSSGYACWSSGGLETQMFTFFVLLAITAYMRADSEPRFFRWLAIALALAAMTRPEGLLISAIIGTHRILINGFRDRRVAPTSQEVACVGTFLLIWAPWFAWRTWYYGHLFPNTYYVKAAGDAAANYAAQMHANGRHYIVQWLTQSQILYAIPVILIGLIPVKPSDRLRFVFGSLALAISAIYLFYVMRVGGDFMGLHRFVMPLFVIAAIGFSLGLQQLTNRIPVYRTPIAIGLSLLCFGGFAFSQWKLTTTSTSDAHWKSDNGIDTPAYLAIYAHDRKRIGERMRSCFRDDDFSIFGGVGAKPYHAKAKGIDVFGLVSEVIAHQVPRTRARAGHNKWGPDSLLYETYKPDFVFHCYSIHTKATNSRLNCVPSFWLSKGYQQVTMHVPGLRERGEYYTFFVAADRIESFRATCLDSKTQ